MRKLEVDGKVHMVPESYAECSDDQVSGVCVAQQALKMAKEARNEDKVDKVKMSILFCLVPNLSLKLWNKLVWWQKAKVMNVVRWAFVTRVEGRPFEFIEVDSVRYHLPADGYGDTSAIEWALLNIYYLAYTKSNKEEFFFKIIATICRRERADVDEHKNDAKGWNGDVREVFNMQLVEEAEGVMKTVAFGKLIAVFHYWESMNAAFVKRNDELFAGDSGEGMFANGEGCLSLLEDVAEEGVMGDLDKVHGCSVVNLFMYLRHKQKKIERREREMNKQTEE